MLTVEWLHCCYNGIYSELHSKHESLPARIVASWRAIKCDIKADNEALDMISWKLFSSNKRIGHPKPGEIACWKFFESFTSWAYYDRQPGKQAGLTDFLGHVSNWKYQFRHCDDGHFSFLHILSNLF